MAANDDGPKPSTPREDRADLLNYHVDKLRPLIAAAAAQKALLDEANALVTDQFHLAKADTRLDRKAIQRGMDFGKLAVRAQMEDREEWEFICSALGYPIQQELVFGTDATPTQARDELYWEAEGYRVGRQVGNVEAPDDVPSMFVQAWKRGCASGTDVTIASLTRAEKLVAQRGEPGGGDAEDLDDDEEDDDDEDEQIALAAEKLKRKGFHKKGDAVDDEAAA